MNADVHLTISDDPVGLPQGWNDGTDGAELIFLGRVRGSENGRPITGIVYSSYNAMALPELERIHQAVTASHGPHRVIVHHRTGFVPNGDASLVIACASRHSPTAFALVADYLRLIKASLPVWKSPVFADA